MPNFLRHNALCYFIVVAPRLEIYHALLCIRMSETMGAVAPPKLTPTGRADTLTPVPAAADIVKSMVFYPTVKDHTRRKEAQCLQLFGQILGNHHLTNQTSL